MTTLRRCAAIGMALAIACVWPPGATADHRDAPPFNKQCIEPLDLGGLYVFRSPSNANNTVFIMTVSPFAGASSPSTFKPGASYELKINRPTHPFQTDELTIRATFGQPQGGGVQSVQLTGSPASAFPNSGQLAFGNTNSNLPVSGGGLFRAGLQDDPHFFDAVGFARFLKGKPFPRPVGQAANFFGPNVNILAIVLEIPSSTIATNNTEIASWARTVNKRGKQIDRMGMPFINIGLIPPVPRDVGPELRDDFNRGHPSSDKSRFGGKMAKVLRKFYGRTSADASTIANILLPDVLYFEIGNPNGFGTFVGSPVVLGNGRRLRDDVVDFMLTVLTNGAIPTDNVPDDNGTKITDGNMGTTAAFPYIGAANLPGTKLPGPRCRR